MRKAAFYTVAVLVAVVASGGPAIAGSPVRCAPADFVPADKSIRNVVEPGEIVVRSTDRLILVNQNQNGPAPRKVIFGRATEFRDAVTVKDCRGDAETNSIHVTGHLDVGTWNIDGNHGTVTFHPVGNVWVLK